ncbi:MAG: amidohydrolase [Desulfobulbaceae bacterium]|jgi:5-methylthioadenosine/S-adenosylhomocysteine deaminase|nr:amidohydrolase [Desulfobulbaceae bacterium]
MTAAEPSLIISGRYLLPQARQTGVLENHGLAISGGVIADIASTETLRSRYPKARHVHTEDGLVMPGLVNSHTHAAMSLFRGLADDLPLENWLNNSILPAERQLTAEMVYWGTLLSCAEMIRSGTTAFCDMYLFAKEVARAAAASKMRAWVGEVFYDFPSPSYGPPEQGFVYLDEMFEKYREDRRLSVTINPHSVYLCSPGLLERLAEIARSRAAIVNTHLSETAGEVKTCLERYGLRPAAHLDCLGLLTPNTLAAHGVHINEEEIALLAERGVGISHCLQSNLKLASGIAPVPLLLEKEAKIGLGTDGSASNNNVDLFTEMKSVALVHKGVSGDPTAMPAETVLHLATMGGGAALGAAATIGSLEVGKKADCIVVDLAASHLTPLYNLPSQLVYAATGSDVRHSIIDGEIIMRDRKILAFDEQEVRAKAREYAGKFRAGM